MLLIHRSMQTCECGFISTTKFNFERHRSSRRHEINMLCSESLVMNEDGYYECNLCNYRSSNEINYRRHVSSDKHKVAKERRMQTSVVPQQTTIAMPMSNVVSGIENVKPVMLVEVMEMCLNFMKQDRDSQNMQQTEMFKMFADRITAHQSHQTQQAQLLHQTQQAQQLTINANKNTTTTNQKFNLNFFLNEQCKNAMNLTDFIERLVISMEDLEHMCEVGYTQGMSKIITKAMNDTQTSERPIHCSDAKRETMYVRKDDAWQKDPDKEECQRLIDHITSKNYKRMSKWRQDNPDSQVSDSPEYDKWFRMTRAMCNADPKAMKKLIHHLALTTEIEKED